MSLAIRLSTGFLEKLSKSLPKKIREKDLQNPKDLNSIKISVPDLRKELARLQQDGYEEIGLEDFLRFLYATLHKGENGRRV